MNKETRKALESEVARIVPRAIYKMKNTYKDEKSGGFLTLQDFFLALPFKIVIQESDEETINQLENSNTYPSIFKWVGGYTKLVKDDNDYKFLKVFITVIVPRDLESPGDAVNWINNTILNNDDLKGENALLLVYMHEVMHIMHKHLLPVINAKFDAIIDQHWNNESKVPEHIKHKIKNFAEDFLINSLLLENAHSDSDLFKLGERVRNNISKITFLYNPKLAASRGHTVESIIKELVKNMEAKEIKFSCNCDQSQQGDQCQQGGSQSDQSQQGSGQGGQDGQCQQGGSQESQIKGAIYRIKYGNFEYEILDLHDEGAMSQSENSGDEAQEAAEAARSISNQITNKLKGSGSAAIAASLGMPIEVTVDWLDKLESDLFKEVRKYTHKTSSTWRRLKNKYRNIAPLPATVNYENVLNAIIVIDQSGSMGNLELRKINYIIKKLVKRVKQLQVIIHDYKIVYNKKFKYKIEQQLVKELFSKRHAAGGTSHRDVFSVIEEEYQKNKNEDFIVLIFSDMYSDIQDIWNQHKWTENVSTYLVATDKQGAKLVKNLPAYVIDMETGQKIK